jgi:hypothetical protein
MFIVFVKVYLSMSVYALISHNLFYRMYLCVCVCFYYCVRPNSSPIPRILAQIMAKLAESIDKNCLVLQQNPMLALQCLVADFTQKDVKKAYRGMILKYHPDKNPDCDTSCIFTAIQAAYESMLELAPSSSSVLPPPAAAATATAAAPMTSARGGGGGGGGGGAAGGLHSSFFQPSAFPGGSSSRRTQQHAPAPPPRPRRSAPAPREEDYYRSGPQGGGGGGGQSQSQSGDVYGMTSEQIRRSLRLLAGGGDRRRQQTDKELAGCSREQLVRKYLHARARALSGGASEAQWRQQLAELRRKERKREQEQQRAREEQQQQQRSAEEADTADSQRQERVSRMQKELPLMSITELRRMMNTW